MRTANLFLFLGTIGFLNIYEDLMGEDEGGKFDSSDEKRLQKKYGVKEKRSAVRSPQSELRSHFEDYREELVEFLKRPVQRGLKDCGTASDSACNCLSLICFGQADCTANVTQPQARLRHRPEQRPQLAPDDPRYVYYATSRRLKARHAASWRMRAREAELRSRQFLRCRQTTISPFVLCECKKYTRLK